MSGNRFERIINGSFKEQSAIVNANVVIEDIDVRSGYGFALEWDELGFLSAGRSEQNFTVTGATSGAVRSQDGNERSTTVATTDNGQTVQWTVTETYDNDTNVGFQVRQELGQRSDSTADLSVYQGVSSSEILDGSSKNEKVFLNGGNDTYRSSDDRSAFNGGVDEVYGNSGNDSAYLYNRETTTNDERYAGSFDGGTGTDTLYLNGATNDYKIYQHGDTMVFRNQNFDDDSNLGRTIAHAKNVERFEGQTLNDNTVIDAYAERARFADGQAPTDLSAIRDFDGNDLGKSSDWKLIGEADAQYDNDGEFIFVNSELGRWATVGPDNNGKIDFDDYGAGGDTRVVGIYIDPEVEAGNVVRGSEFDSQQRFQNDLKIDNLTVKDAFDFDADGAQEMYFEVNDGSAYLRALMHSDGNIQYANYQSEEQVTDYLTGLGYGQDVLDTVLM